jgi:5-methylcytosine-specific restriction enzyme subunit McrC
MRTIRLVEHEAQALRLSRDEARELLTLPRALLEVAARAGDGWLLTPKSRVGTVVLPSLRLLIRPKAGMRNTLYLLASAFRVDWSDDRFPYDTDDLALAIGWWLDREVERAARWGLVHDYVDRRELLTTIRGRVAFERQLAARPGLRIPIECTFQDYSEDTPLNRVLKAAHYALLRMPGLDVDLARRLRHRARLVLGGVRKVDYAPGALPEIPQRGVHREWEAALGIARLILSELTIRDAPGTIDALAFTVDMNVLFQHYVTAVTRERAAAAGCVLEAGRVRALTTGGTRADGAAVPAVTIKPDLVLIRDDAPVAVSDIKYKLPGGGAGWRPSDAYQLIAYCVRLGLAQGLLVMCGARPLSVSQLVDAPLALATIGVDLSGTPAQILAQARAAADALLAQADGSAAAAA